MTELGYPEIQFQGQMRFYGSSKLPADVLAKLRAAIKKAAESPAVQQRLMEVGMEPDVNIDSAGMLAEDTQRYARNGEIVRKFSIRMN